MSESVRRPDGGLARSLEYTLNSDHPLWSKLRREGGDVRLRRSGEADLGVSRVCGYRKASGAKPAGSLSGPRGGAGERPGELSLVPVVERRLEVLPVSAARGEPRRLLLVRLRRRGMDEDSRSQQLDARGPRPTPLHQCPDAVSQPASHRSQGEPHRTLPAALPHPRELGGAPGRAPLRRRRERSLRLPERASGGHEQGLAAPRRVRRDAIRRAGRERSRGHGDPLVRRDLSRGPGPLVHGRHLP